MYVMIQKRQKTVEKGRPVEKWDDYLKCWCEVKSLYGKELYTALEAKLANVMNFETRYCKALEALNTKEYRVVWGERIFKLINADYGKYDRRKVVLKGQEVVRVLILLWIFWDWTKCSGKLKGLLQRRN